MKYQVSFRAKTWHLHMWKYHRCYGYIINCAFHTKKLLKWNGLVVHWCSYNRTLHGCLEIQNFVSPHGHVISSISANLCRVKRSFKPYQNEHNSVKDTEKKGHNYNIDLKISMKILLHYPPTCTFPFIKS